ncbi:hypothetical protein BFP71_15955 [Roseivirga misakiensis]|uniref:Uncharacterized protein n=2 Tax=Roseivirga misakiensis TaxID=1563681 RepID=A0A1E5T0N8_9BACT|nr:hypothetical protein BFP71_15955 [Roseivirga misakiensis]
MHDLRVSLAKNDSEHPKERIVDGDYNVSKNSLATYNDILKKSAGKVTLISSQITELIRNTNSMVVSRQFEIITNDETISENLKLIDKLIEDCDKTNKLIKLRLSYLKKVNLTNRSRRKIAKSYPIGIIVFEPTNEEKKDLREKKEELLNESFKLEQQRQELIESTMNSDSPEDLSNLHALNGKIDSQGIELNTQSKFLGKSTYVSEMVEVILKASGHKIESIDYQENSENVDIKSIKENELHLTRCSIEPISEDSIIELQNATSEIKYHYSSIICDNIIEPSAKKLQEDLPTLEVKTVSEFIRGEFYLDAYLTWLQNGYKKEGIADLNIPLSVTEQVTNSQKNQKKQYSEQVKLSGYLDNWIKSGNSNRHYTILGDYGTGKSWFCWEYAIQQLREYQKNPVGNRLPILIHLKEYKTFKTWEDLFELFCERFKITKLKFEVFQELNSLGRFLIIFDGFDELFTAPKSQPAIEKFFQLNRAAPANSKVLLTSRTTFFRNIDDETFDPNQSDGLPLEQRVDLKVHPNFKKLFLKPFEDTEIKGYLKKKAPLDWEQSYYKIKNHPNLFDLAKRPILLKMISETLPFLEEKEDFNEFDLYSTYTDQWINEAGVGRTKNLLKPKQRLDLMTTVAWKMYTDGGLTIKNKKLDAIISRFLPEEKWDDVVEILDEIKGHTFLITNDKDTYCFAHKSFFEFFIALELANKVSEENKEDLQKLNKRIEQEILAFLDHTRLSVQILSSWLSEKHKGNDQAIFNGNLINLLRTQGFDFKGFDFSGLAIHYPNFSNSNVTGANFQNTLLIQFDARDAIMDKANFVNAKLESLILGVRSSAKYVTSSIKHIAVPNGKNEIELYPSDQPNQPKIILSGHHDSVANLAFSPSGKLLASSSFDKFIILWDVEKGKEVLRLKGHHDTVYGLAFGRNGKLIVSGDNSHTLKVWNTQDGKEMLSFNWGHSKAIYSIDYHPKMDLIATGSFDSTIGIWSFEKENDEVELELIGQLDEHTDLVNHVCFSPDGKMLASASNDKTIILWDIKPENPKPVFRSRLEGHDQVVWSVFFSPDSNFLASGGSDNKVRIWDIITGEQINLLEGHTADVWSVVFSKDGQRVISGSFDSSLKIWDWKSKTNKLLKSHSLIEDKNSEMSCKGMHISKQEISGLSTLQTNFLFLKGAILDENGD